MWRKGDGKAVIGGPALHRLREFVGERGVRSGSSECPPFSLAVLAKNDSCPSIAQPSELVTDCFNLLPSAVRPTCTVVIHCENVLDCLAQLEGEVRDLPLPP